MKFSNLRLEERRAEKNRQDPEIFSSGQEWAALLRAGKHRQRVLHLLHSTVSACVVLCLLGEIETFAVQVVNGISSKLQQDKCETILWFLDVSCKISYPLESRKLEQPWVCWATTWTSSLYLEEWTNWMTPSALCTGHVSGTNGFAKAIASR